MADSIQTLSQEVCALIERSRLVLKETNEDGKDMSSVLDSIDEAFQLWADELDIRQYPELHEIKHIMKELNHKLESYSKRSILRRRLSSKRVTSELSELLSTLSLKVSKLFANMFRRKRELRQAFEADPWSGMFGPVPAVDWSSFVTEMKQRIPSITPTRERMLKRVLDNSTSNIVLGSRFGQFLEGFGPFKQCIQNLEDLCSKPYFYAFLSKEESEKFLATQPVGTFLVRFSSSQPRTVTIDFVPPQQTQLRKPSARPLRTSGDDPLRTQTEYVADIPNKLQTDEVEIESERPKSMPRTVSAALGFGQPLPNAVRVCRIDDGRLEIESTHPKFSKRTTFESLGALIDAYDNLFQTPFITDIHEQPWFRGDITSAETVELLNEQPPGTFIVRFGTELGTFTLCFVDKDKPSKDNITKIRLKASDSQYYCDQTQKKYFGSVQGTPTKPFKSDTCHLEFIEYCKKDGKLTNPPQKEPLKLGSVELVRKESVSLVRKIQNYDKESFLEGKILGQGSFGEVYSVQLESNGGKYAMKKMTLDSNYSEEKKADIIRSFEKEMELLEKLRHPNIVRYVGYRCDSTSICLFMELMDGSLWDVIQGRSHRHGKFTLSEILRFLKDISCGLAYLHSQHVAHRDLKCENILVWFTKLNNPYKLCISDFGTARELAGEWKATTLTGTLCYMAPEVPTKNYNPFSADVWSLGIIIYELLVLDHPAPHFHMERPKIPSSVNTDVFIQKLYEKCTHIKPEERPTAKSIFDEVGSTKP